MADSKIDEKKLDDYTALLEELWTVINKLNNMHQLFTVQERQVAGGFVFQARCPWKDLNFSVMAGEGDIVAGLVNRAVNHLRQPVEPQKPIFGKKDGDKLPN